ncbi:MAG TPA: tetratricopeptide repeat protein, partial [Vicinamibacterales bacterium]
IEVRENAGTLRLLTPEEAGPVLTILIDGAAGESGHPDVLSALAAAPGDFEIVLVDPDPGLIASIPDGRRVRFIRTRAVTRSGALAIGQACARGRHLLCLPAPAEISGLDRLLEVLRGAAPDQVFACALEPAGARVGIFGRRAIDRAGGIDPLSALPLDDLLRRVECTSAAAWLDDVRVMTVPWKGIASGIDSTAERGWTRLASGAAADAGEPVPALLVADFQRRAELLLEHLRGRISRALPADAGSVAVWGFGPLTALAVMALRALDRAVTGVFTADADGSATCAGVPVRHARELDPSWWIVAVPASPAEAAAFRDIAPAARVVELGEADGYHPVPMPLGAAPAGLAHARALRERGLLEQAEAACRASLRDAALADPAPVRYELALVQQQRGRLREAEAGFRWLLRHWPEQRGTVSYNLASLLKTRGRLDRAARLFERVLADEGPDGQRAAGCHFHLGEIQLSRGDVAGARTHFERTLRLVPAHGRARERLARLDASQAQPENELTPVPPG